MIFGSLDSPTGQAHLPYSSRVNDMPRPMALRELLFSLAALALAGTFYFARFDAPWPRTVAYITFVVTFLACFPLAVKAIITSNRRVWVEWKTARNKPQTPPMGSTIVNACRVGAKELHGGNPMGAIQITLMQFFGMALSFVAIPLATENLWAHLLAASGAALLIWALLTSARWLLSSKAGN